MTATAPQADLTTFAGRLRHALQLSGHSLGWLVRRRVVSRSWLYALLAGVKRGPRQDTVAALATTLGVDPGWLMFGTNTTGRT